MKRILFAVAALVVIGLAVSLGGIIVDEANRVFWTHSLIWTALTTLVLAPVLVFAGTSRAQRSSAKPASKRPASKRPAAAAPFVSEQAKSGALSPSPRQPAPSRSSPDVRPPNAAPAPQPAADDGAARRRPRSNDASAVRTSRSATRSTGRTVAYALTGGILLWLVTSLAGIFLDNANLAFWTNSLMWTLLAIVLWGPALAFIVNPLTKGAPATPADAQKGDPSPAVSPASPSASSSPATSSDPATSSKPTDGSELQRTVSRSVPESEQVEPPAAPSATPAASEPVTLRTPKGSPSASEPEWPIWPDDE